MGQVKTLFVSGDKVRIIDCREIRAWRSWPGIVNKDYIIDSKEAEALNKGEYIYPFENYYSINVSASMLEKRVFEWDN
jgi:hypothetical protein